MYDDTELITTVNAPQNTMHCRFDIFKAVQNSNSGTDNNGNTDDTVPQSFCEIIGTEANGYVSTPKFKATTISGNVTFIFYDSSRDEIAKESTYEYHYMYDATELVAKVTVPSHATSCAFDISKAIQK